MSLTEALDSKTVTVLGGTRSQGRGLARRFAVAGLPVVIGSRSAQRAADTAAELAAATGGAITGADSVSAAAAGEIVVVAMPWDGRAELLAGLAVVLAGKGVVDCVSPLDAGTNQIQRMVISRSLAKDNSGSIARGTIA